MFGFDILDIMIGLFTVYLSFGIACTAAVEGLASLFKLRSKNLEKGIEEFFNGRIRKGSNERFVDAFYAHPLVHTLSYGKTGRPSYIPPNIMGEAVISLLLENDRTNDLETNLNSLPSDSGKNQIRNLLLILFEQSKGNMDEFKAKLENHFDESMERVSGWFKRKIQYITIGVSIVMVFFANADTVDMARYLSANPEARAAMLLTATEILEKGSNAQDETKEKAKIIIDKAVGDLEKSGLRIGWDPDNLPKGKLQWITKLMGLFITSLCISLGAPFWFNLLQKIMEVRGAGKKIHAKAQT